MDAIEGGCPYLQTADGRKLEVIYPDGWTIRKAPLKLLAPDGSVHSRAGDVVSDPRHRGDRHGLDLPDRTDHPGHGGPREPSAGARERGPMDTIGS